MPLRNRRGLLGMQIFGSLTGVRGGAARPLARANASAAARQTLKRHVAAKSAARRAGRGGTTAGEGRGGIHRRPTGAGQTGPLGLTWAGRGEQVTEKTWENSPLCQGGIDAVADIGGSASVIPVSARRTVVGPNTVNAAVNQMDHVTPQTGDHLIPTSCKGYWRPRAGQCSGRKGRG